MHHVPRQRLIRGFNEAVLAIALAITAGDAATKWWARRELARHAVHVGGPLWWRLEYNTGISFSLSGGLPLFTAVGTSLVSLAVLVIGLRARPGVPSWGFGLLLGGGIANAIDRWSAAPHRVTDFIAVQSFSVFNVADVAVTLGFLLLLLAIVRGQRLVQR